MTPTIKSTFDRLASSLVIDRDWLTKLARFRIGFTLRNEEHIEFFGGNLYGVNVVRFSPMDRAFLFEELLQVEETVVDRALDDVPTVIKKFIVTGDSFNNAGIWLIHRVLTDTTLDEKQRYLGATDIALLLNYRFFTSLLYRRFLFKADKGVALAVYASLSRKFAIKQFGSWNRVFEERVKETLAKTSIHYNTFIKMDDDLKVRYAISDMQGRLRSMASLLMREHMIKSDEKERIGTSSATMQHDGEAILKDRTKTLGGYTSYLQSIVADRNAFIKPELVNVIQQIMPTMPPKLFSTMLVELSALSSKIDRKRVDTLLNDTMVHAFSYLFQNRQLVRNTSDLPTILGRLKGTYSSARNTDQQLLDLRERFETLITETTKIKHSGNKSAVRTGLLLYLVARAMTKNHYS